MTNSSAYLRSVKLRYLLNGKQILSPDEKGNHI